MHTSAQTKHEVKGAVCRFPRQNYVKTQILEVHGKKNVAALKIPMSKWAVWPPSSRIGRNRNEKDFLSGSWPRTQWKLCGKRITFHQNISAAVHQLGLLSRLARWKPLLTKGHVAACLEFAERHLKDIQTMKDKRCSCLMRQRMNSLVWLSDIMVGRNQAQLISWPIPSPQSEVDNI